MTKLCNYFGCVIHMGGDISVYPRQQREPLSASEHLETLIAIFISESDTSWQGRKEGRVSVRGVQK